MVIDTSALVAVLQDAPEWRAFNEAIEAAERRVMPTAAFVEISMIVESRYGPEGVRDLDLFPSKLRTHLVSVNAKHAHIAHEVFGHYGKGRHPAGLNLGDFFPMRWPRRSTSLCCARAPI